MFVDWGCALIVLSGARHAHAPVVRHGGVLGNCSQVLMYWLNIAGFGYQDCGVMMV